jgi:predicted small metal-binding protein
MTRVAMRYQCLEAGCGLVVVASTEEELVAAVNKHIGDVHNSIELEDVILANSEQVNLSETSEPPT